MGKRNQAAEDTEEQIDAADNEGLAPVEEVVEKVTAEEAPVESAPEETAFVPASPYTALAQNLAKELGVFVEGEDDVSITLRRGERIACVNIGEFKQMVSAFKVMGI